MFQIETISAKMLDYYVGRRDAFIIDLRVPQEYKAGHIRGAVNVPYETLDDYQGFPKDKLLILYCDRGGASLDAAKRLVKQGYQTRSVIGGMQAYRGRNLVISR